MYWDGSYKCEGVLRSLKPLINHGTFNKHFARHGLARYYKEKFISHILGPDLMKDMQGDGNNTYERYNNFKTYPTILAAKLDIDAGRPFSLIVFHDDTIGFSCMHGGNHVVV